MSNETCAARKTLSVRIEATPDRALSPNARCHWRVKNRKRDDLKHAVFGTLISVLNVIDPADAHAIRTAGCLTLSWTIYWEKRRRFMDHDNSIAILKYAQDAVADVIDIDDKHFRVGTVEQKRDPGGKGYMELTITAGADA